MTAFAFRMPELTGNVNDVYDDQGPGFVLGLNMQGTCPSFDIPSAFGIDLFPCYAFVNPT